MTRTDHSRSETSPADVKHTLSATDIVAILMMLLPLVIAFLR